MIILALAAYVIIQLGIAAWAARNTESGDDYLVAGRTLSVWQVAMSIFATWFAAETVIATAAEVRTDGLAGARVEPLAYGLGIVLLGLFVAQRVRAGGHLTLAGFLGSAFGREVQIASAIIIAISATVWAGAQLNALAVIIGEAASVPFLLALIVGTGIVILYTWLGGLKGDVATDVLQGGVIILGLLIILAMLVGDLGSDAQVPPEALQFQTEDESVMDKAEIWLIPIFGTVVAQEAVSRLLGAKTPEIARKGALLGAAVYVVAGMIPVALGLLGPAAGISDTGDDTYFARMAEAVLPAWLFVIVSGALISAILSSVDSALLAVSAAATETQSRAGQDDKKRLRLARMTTTAAGIVAMLIAASGESLRDTVVTASGISALLLIPVAAGLFMPHAGRRPVLLSIASSFVAMALLDWWLGVSGATLYALAIGAAFFLAAAAIRETRSAA